MRTTIVQFILAALLVVIIGGSAGWYFFIKNKTSETAAELTARGDVDSASFGGQVGSTYQNISESSGTSTAEIGKRSPRLWHVTKTPVAGFGFGPSGASVFIAERATGNILRADPNTSTILRLTNTLIPKVRDAIFSRSGDVILRTTNDQEVVTTFAGSIATTTVITSTSTPNVLEGTYLPQNIVAIDTPNYQVSSKGIVYVTALQEGGSIGVSSGWKGVGSKKIFSSPLSQWRIQALADGRSVIVQNASDNASGYSFMVSASGVMRPLVSAADGLTLVYHDTADAYLYGQVVDGRLTLYAKAGSAAAVKLPIETTADKCVWAPGVGLIAYCAVPATAPLPGYLVKWYEGAEHTRDVWWRVEAAAGTATRFFVSDTNTYFDVEEPSMDETGSIIGWRDAADKSLWLLRVAE
ncbi:MAG: hypothetical protein KBD06_03275 [Candidatus Pacebacteria bacterium]|nr:hypothetical protein [Candidatus Paceibacterota bacterium]